MSTNILLALTGSVASLKAPLLVEALIKAGVEDKDHIRVVTTQSALHFYNPVDLGVKFYTDKDEWEMWERKGDPVLHVELRKWADILIIAPLDANTMAKMAGGFCDNLLTCIVRAWDQTKPLLVAPAMNTHMWTHPHTARHLAMLKELGYKVIPPISKCLACGDT
eukprot:Ihof_evm4s206 gene=Ihof_evmTU4s206